MSVRKYHYSLHNPEVRSSHLLRGGSLRSHVSDLMYDSVAQLLVSGLKDKVTVRLTVCLSNCRRNAGLHAAVGKSNPLRRLMTSMECIDVRACVRERVTNWLRMWRTNLPSDRLHNLLTLVVFGTSTSYCMRRRRLWIQSSVVSRTPKSRKYVRVNRTSALTDAGPPPKPDETFLVRVPNLTRWWIFVTATFTRTLSEHSVLLATEQNYC
jgi:hypothetical protein